MFFAIPLNNKPDWHHPPLITILLVLINFIVFFGPQRIETNAQENAARFYAASKILPNIEFPRFAQYLRESGNTKKARMADAVERAINNGDIDGPLQAMEHDQDFQRLLAAGKIVKADDEHYEEWKQQRTKYEALKGSPFTERWASNPSDWNPVSLITSVFLHGSTGHLIGNMIFLCLFGFTVEQTLGGKRYLALYLLAGACGDLGDLLARLGSTSIGLGASGAISGLMASYAVLYGRQRIRFFYQLLFYFDYVKAPAIILLPVWIAHEFLQQALNPEGGVAYMAHAGGLLSGAALTYFFKKRSPDKNLAPPTTIETENPVDVLQQRASAALKALKLDEARDLYRKLAKLAPKNSEFVSTYFNLAKRTPADEHFHRAFRYVTAFSADDPESSKWIYDCYQTYVSTAKPPRLGAEMTARLAFRFAREGRLQEADRLLRVLISREPTHGEAPNILLALLTSCLKQGSRPKALEYKKALDDRHGDTPQARMAEDILRQQV
ncbi:MAG: rhomboid family intrarane serine protease [Proteobacteria bacterium]|nr:rhomboid family intrarane serine protease [Pseudomonadota bacterium]